MRKMNDYGLTRELPDSVKRQVRQRCGFGCVRCGFALYDYHHFDPPFRDAKIHDPAGITLLCKTCHGLVDNSRIISNQMVAKYDRTPKCLEKGYSYGPFVAENGSPIVVLGNITIISTPIILEVFGKPLIMIEPPEEQGTPFRLSATFHDESGNELLRIIQNQWQGFSSNWDIETKGPRIIIRQAPRRIALKIRMEPPGRLVIEQLNMFYRGLRIIGEEGQPTTAYLPDGRMWFTTPKGGGPTIIGCGRAIVIE